jgi:hypothetical protein
MAYTKVIRYPITAEDAGDNTTTLLDGEGKYIIYQNIELSLEQWKFVAEALNAYADKGKFMPDGKYH